MSSPILRQLNLPNALTLTGLALTFLSVAFAVRTQFSAAILCMIWAGITDLFDGFVARRVSRTPLQADVGKHLDSLVDICSFGFGPAVFAYSYGFKHPLLILLLVGYLIANAMRLAYFNAVGMASEGSEAYFTGMPVTYAALFIPSAFVVSFVLPQPVVVGVLAVLYLAMAGLMVSGLRIRKPRGIWYGIFTGVALLLSGVYGMVLVMGR